MPSWPKKHPKIGQSHPSQGYYLQALTRDCFGYFFIEGILFRTPVRHQLIRLKSNQLILNVDRSLDLVRWV